jgi:hypothetical protein
MLYKKTTKLFKGTYQYKIVLVCAGASWFRSGDMDATLENLNKVQIDDSLSGKMYYSRWKTNIRTKEDLDYAFKLQSVLKSIKNIDVRVESPWITVYTNQESDLDSLIKIDSSKVKYICKPPTDTTLDKNTIIMPNRNFDYKVTLGKTTSEHSSFISWAEKSNKLKITKSCKSALTKDRSWGGSHFYVSGENNLLMVKMHLGGSIVKIERIVKEKA